MKSNTFCILPWIHINTRPSGTVRICCTANASTVGSQKDIYNGRAGEIKDITGASLNFNTHSMEEIWNSDYLKNIRLQMLKGQKPISCMKCYNEEDSGYNSKRQWETDYWNKRVDVKELISSTQRDGSLDFKFMQYIDLRMGNKCQLSCIICSPHDSSGWVTTWKKLLPNLKNSDVKDIMSWDNKGKYDGNGYNWHKNNEKFWKDFWTALPNLKQIYFAGGESTIISEHKKILLKSIESGHSYQIELRYNSNAIDVDSELIELWNHFAKVRFHYSIDSFGSMNDYIRYPSNWDHTLKQLLLLDETSPHVEITIACSIQFFNIFYIPDFVKWKLNYGFKKINPWPFSAGTINTHWVAHPAFMSAKTLPKWFKKQTTEKYQDFYNWLEQNWKLSGAKDLESFLSSSHGVKRFKGMINHMNHHDWSNRLVQTQDYIETLDSIRNTNYQTVFPEMSKIFH